ncbi:MAG TPA: CmcI family methyltransferase [Dehalococcoidia bacterium]|nr:CmcI family methyltransferase [Dehalococcoidia bacterium]
MNATGISTQPTPGHTIEKPNGLMHMARGAAKSLLGSAIVRRPVTNAFHIVSYHSPDTWQKNTFLGYPILQGPIDLYLYQELIYRLKPAFILQTGIAGGGSLLYFATLLDLIGAPTRAVVAGIDIDLSDSALTLTHSRIRMFHGSSTDPEIVSTVREALPPGTGLVVLDSDHSCAHVRKELSIYSDFVGVGSYLVCEDTNINGHPVNPFWGPGPHEAMRDFLEHDKRFINDEPLWRRNLFTHHGWMRRVA